MLAKRIIPCLDVADGRVVKGVKFLGLRDAGDPVEIARRYDQEGADEIVFLDIRASTDNRETMVDVVRRTAEQVYMPLCVGGGIRTIEDIRRMLQAGADKVSINTPAIENPEFVNEAARRFGSQCIVVAIDAKRLPDGSYQVKSHGGRDGGRPTPLEPVAWAREVEQRGAGEILLTCMDCDGTKDGYDIPLTRAVADAVSIPVIASGARERWTTSGPPYRKVERMPRWQPRFSITRNIPFAKPKNIAPGTEYPCVCEPRKGENT